MEPKVIVEGDFKDDFVRSALLEVYLKKMMPASVEYIVFMDNPKQFDRIKNVLPKEAVNTIADVYYNDPTSLSITYKHFDIIIVSISKEESYLKTNKKAMVGLLLHELMHLKQRRRGLDTAIEKDGKKELANVMKKAVSMKHDPRDVGTLLLDVYDASVHILKEIYDNIELINNGFGEYVLEDHKNLYRGKNVPYFYDSLKKARKNKEIQKINAAFIYELNLMAAVIPFSLMAEKGNKEAKKFVLHIQNNFEAAIYEISSEFTDLINFGLDHFKWTSKFRRQFFRKIFTLCCDLLK